MKKIFMFLLLFMITLTISGCVDRTPVDPVDNPVDDQPVDEEPITLTIYSQLANTSGEATGWFAQELLERFNVKLLIIPDTEGVYETRMEDENLGDIVIWGSDGDEYKNAVQEGALFDWEEDDLVQEYGPYIYEYMQQALEKNRDISGTGQVYGFGHNVAYSSDNHESFFYNWDIRYDLYTELGSPTITNLDDYLQLMLDMKELEPLDEVGNPTYATSLWPDWDGNTVMYIKSFATAYYGYDELALGLYDVETGEFHDALAIDEETGEFGPYLEALQFFNQLYQNDLLDPDSMTNTFTAATEKALNGGTFFSIFNFSGSAVYNTTEHLDDNKIMLPLAPEEATPITYGMNVKGGNRVWSIGAKSQYPELCMEIINWLATPEGVLVSNYGPQGITWDYDDDGYIYATDLGKLMHEDRDTEFTVDTGYTGTFGDGVNPMNNTTFSLDVTNPDSPVNERFNWDYWVSNQEDAKNDLESLWRTTNNVLTVQEYFENREYKVALGSTYSESQRSDELEVIWSQVTTAIVEGSWQAIYANSDAEFNFLVNNMISQANKYGYDDCVDWSLGEATARFNAEEAARNE